MNEAEEEDGEATRWWGDGDFEEALGAALVERRGAPAEDTGGA